MDSTSSKKNCDAQYKVEYMPIDDVEKLERYSQGGYHPVTIGEQLHDRYCIVHKFGFGAYSTIWLARDQNAGKYVAIKVPVAKSDPTESQETNILRQLNIEQLKLEAPPGAACIPLIIDDFCISGPNGVHHCFVTVPGMMSISDAKDASSLRLFQLPAARAIVAQLVQAVAFLHPQGIVHGDLHDGNVLIRLSENMDALSPEQLYQKFGSPRYEPVVRLDHRPLCHGVPANVVVPVWLGKESENISLSEARIILTDFGESFMPATVERHYSNAPGIFTPPEVHFEPHKSLSFPADIWTLACTIWTVIGQRPLFEGFYPSADCVTKEHVDCLGKLPDPWWLKWEARTKWFNEDGTRKNMAFSRPLEQRFFDAVNQPRQEFNMQEIGEAEKFAFLDMLRAMLTYDPAKRTTASEVLTCEWMQKWALPELSRLEQS